MNAIVGLTDLTEMTDGLPDKAKENLLKIKASSQYLLGLINDILDMSRIENGRMTVAKEPFSMHSLLDGIESMVTQDAACLLYTSRSLGRADAGEIPVIAMTANAFAEDVQSAIEAGMTAHVAKPIDVGILKTTLYQTIKCGVYHSDSRE